MKKPVIFWHIHVQILMRSQFYNAGGMVVAVGALPEASDRAGREDPELDAVVVDIFGASAAQVKAGKQPAVQKNVAGGIGIAAVESNSSGLRRIIPLLPRDVQSEHPVKALHRKIGSRDVYMVMGATKGSDCLFRACGNVKLWDPWTGQIRPLSIVSATDEGTKVRMPLEDYEAQVIVFDSQEIPILDKANNLDRVVSPPEPLVLDGPWEFQLKPTLNNQWGDFRLPITNKMIGAEARIFRSLAT